jgi:8-oxo-dGTP pyrophosphatase MutT (NUDIX family)
MMTRSSKPDFSKLTSLDIKNKLSQQTPLDKNDDSVPKAAVLIPIFWQNKQWNVLFIHRSNWVDKHKDQVSFPGGMAEQGDKNPKETALRETREEIGIPSQRVKVLGQLKPLVFRKEYRIYPFVGEIPCPIEITLSKIEVSHSFSIPLNWLANPKHYSLQDYGTAEGEKRQVYFFQEYEHELLWGISAFITIQLLEKLK